jgi:hypothetical protein
MKNLKHKFIIIVWLLIFSILALQVFVSFRENDKSSYITLVEWTAKINDISLELQKKYKIAVWDILSTGEKSLAVIEWWDGSITRIWGNSQIVVKENLISKNLSQIQIATQILKGKAWSKVTTNLSWENHFKVYFDNIEAGVRGTTFDIDLEKQIIFVQDHEITLKKWDLPSIRLWENQPFSLSLFSLIDIKKYIQEFQDIDWKSLNTKLDSEYKEKLTQEALDSFWKNEPFLVFLEIFFPKYRILAELHGNQDEKKIEALIGSLSSDQRQDVYESVYKEYQKINFATPDETEMYKKKLAYKKAILLLTDDSSVKQSLVKGSVYDFQDIIATKNTLWLQETLNFLWEQKNIVKDLPKEVKDFMNIESINLLPPDLKDIMLKNTKMFQDIFQIDITNVDFSLEWVKSLNDTAKEVINSGLDKAFNSILKK